MDTASMIRTINFVIAAAFAICYSYQLFYILLPLVKGDRPHRPTTMHRFAVLISARNEGAVIGQLLESIRLQDYPAELVKVFVVADNCSDDTAEKARRGGAAVYERFNTQLVGKGYAMEFLLSRISADFGEDAFDAFLVFDADNLLKSDYISQMNKTFSDGYNVITSYRNSKNFGDNWVSSGYSLWFLREAEFLNHARMLLGTSCAVSGTGFLFSKSVLARCGGWPFHLLTEDIEFTVHNILQGERFGYCGKAVLYDEQPVKFSQSWRQRERWARGYLQVFGKYGRQMLAGIFKKGGFACYDMCMAIMPAFILTAVSIAANTVAAVSGVLAGQGVTAALLSAGESLLNAYLFLFFIGGVTLAKEWRRIYASTGKKLLSAITFPVFMMTYLPISLTALLHKVEWRPIEHSVAVTVCALESGKAS